MPLHVRDGKHPHQVGFLVAGVILGIVGAVGPRSTTSRALPDLTVYLLYGGVALAALIAIVGVFVPDILGALIERVGLFMLAIMLLGFGVAVIAAAGIRGVSFGLFVAAFAGANLFRVWQIRREIKDLQTTKALLRQGGGE